MLKKKCVFSLYVSSKKIQINLITMKKDEVLVASIASSVDVSFNFFYVNQVRVLRPKTTFLQSFFKLYFNFCNFIFQLAHLI